jgi:hypothetical protein
MILTAHQPVYLPWIGLFHKIALADKFVFFNEVQYLPKDWMNRNKIKTAVDEIWLTVPVLRKGYRERKTSEIEINNSTNWKKKHLQSILLNYKKTPFFENYAPFFEDVYNKEWQYLADLNEYMLRWFLEQLNIKVEFLKASDYNFQGAKSDLVLDMCKQLGSNMYIFGSLGIDYANVDDFTKADIAVFFQDYKHPTYPQLHDSFVSHLSIVDLLFNCGPISLDIIMSGNISKNELISSFTKNTA